MVQEKEKMLEASAAGERQPNGSVDDALAAVVAVHAANAERRRALARDEFRLVKREPKEIAAAIALGMVLMRLGLRAQDSWRLDGLLSGSAADLVDRLQRAAEVLPNANAGEVLVRAIDLAAAELQAYGMHFAWKRKAETYFEEHRAWLESDAELKINGKWRDKKMSADQAELIRATCAILQIDLPGHLLRGSAHDWIESKGANLRYRGVRP